MTVFLFSPIKGVLLWELFTLGRLTPHFESKSMMELYQWLQNGNRLSKPLLCNENIYEVMINCWKLDSNARPKFINLENIFEEISESCGNETGLNVNFSII